MGFAMAHKQLHIHTNFHVLSGVHHVRPIDDVICEWHYCVREIDFFDCRLVKPANH